jgi:hypothetical protein
MTEPPTPDGSPIPSDKAKRRRADFRNRRRSSKTPSPNKVPIQAIVRAMSVLQALAHRPAGVRLLELSRMVSLHKSTVFRVVRTLILLGYVEQVASRDVYAISRSQTLVLQIAPDDSGPT